MNTENTVGPKAPSSDAMTDQEAPAGQPETPQMEIAPPEPGFSATVANEGAFDEKPGEQPEIPQLETAPPAPGSSRKENRPLAIFALIAVIAGIAIAIIYATKDSPPLTEAPQSSEITQTETKTEPEAPPPKSRETVTSPATRKTEKPETKAKTEAAEAKTETAEVKTETEPKAEPEPEQPQSTLRALTHEEFDKIDALERDALSNHEIAKEYYRNGDYEKALEYYQKARNSFEQLLSYSRRSLGDGHANTITIQKNLAAEYNAIGDVYRIQKKYAEAMSWLNKSLDIRERIQGKDHPQTAETYNNIALVYDGQGQYAKALEWFQKDLAISEKVLGSNHPDTAKTYNSIGMVYFHQGDRANALEWFKKAVAIQEKNQPDRNPNAAIAYNNIAEVYRIQHDYALALPEYLKAYRILQNTFGEGHSMTKTVKLNMSRAYEKQKNPQPFDEWLSENMP